MKRIVLNKWKAKGLNGEDVEESLVTVLNVLVNNKKPEEMPKGLDNFRLMGRLANAFEEAEKNNVLELEDSDYSFLKKTVEHDVPAVWGTNKNIMEAINSFLNV